MASMEHDCSSSSGKIESLQRTSEHTAEEGAEALARTVAHLAAQLTMTQLRLRALATVLEERGNVSESEVQSQLSSLAVAETGAYLTENLGPALADVIDVESLKLEIISFLQS
jgi:hypothetical protein